MVINAVNSSQTSISIDILEVPEAVYYILDLFSANESQEVVSLFPEDVDVLDGMFRYTFTRLKPGTEYTIDATYVDEDGTVLIGTVVASTQVASPG